MDAVEYDIAQGLIERAAERVYWGFANQALNAGRTPPVEWEDCVQEGWVGYMSRRDDYAERLDTDKGRNYVRLAVRRHIADFARKEKAERCGYAVEDEQFYTAGKVRALLPLTLDQPAGHTVTGSDRHTEVLDVQRGYEGLCEADQILLWDVYGPQCLTELDAVTRRSAAKAVGRLRDVLNGQV